MEGFVPFAGGLLALFALKKFASETREEEIPGKAETVFKDSEAQAPSNMSKEAGPVIRSAVLASKKINTHQLLNLHKRVRVHDPVDPRKTRSVPPRRGKGQQTTIFGTLREDHPFYNQFD